MNRPARSSQLLHGDSAPRGGSINLDTARHFPLVARARLTCARLDDRIAEVAELTATAGTNATLHAVAHNKAALIASDCGHHDLAATLCHAHHDRYRTLSTWTAHDARLALEPLVNLARLHIRNGNTVTAVGHLHTLWAMVDTGEEHLLDGRPIRLNGIRRGTEDHRAVRTWLWTVVLADGLRAYTNVGRWTDALTHAERHHGVGLRLLDGRQVAILAHAAQHDSDRAFAVLNTSVFDDPWEPVVADCLRALLTSAHAPRYLLDCYADTNLGPRYRLFTARLGLAIVDLLGMIEISPAVFSSLLRRILCECGTDAYIARDVLRHRVASELTTDEYDSLTTTMSRAGLANPPPVGELGSRLHVALAEPHPTIRI